VQSIPCFLCGRQLEKRIDKNRKPYFVCDPCGTQVFVRGKKGRELLEELFRDLLHAKIMFKTHERHLYEIQALIKEVDAIRAEIEKVGISYFFDDDQLRIRNALKTKLDTLLSQLDEIAEPETKK
jgi:DNA-directed RNA polymerase subunit RPC12/RpoP